MNVITPLTTDLLEFEAMLTSSTIAEPDLTMGEAIWNPVTDYAVGTEVIRLETHRRYENTLAGVDAGLPENTPARWLDVGPTNRYAMFDTLRNTQSEAASPLTVVLEPGVRVDSLGIFGIEAESITITMENDSVEVYSYTQDLNTREVLNWYDYFFGPFSTIPSVAVFDLPPYTAGVTTITLSSSTGTVKCGAVVIGNQTYIGAVQYNAVSDEQNFSRIEREFDGTAALTQRRSIPKINATVFADKAQTNKIRALRRNLNAVPAVWSGLDDLNTDEYFEAILILGIYKRFEINLASAEHTLVNLEIEEI
jgi:hypothetical protein